MVIDMKFKFQSLFYWILFFYMVKTICYIVTGSSFNPYSTGFSSFIMLIQKNRQSLFLVSILILLDSLLLFLFYLISFRYFLRFNPYSTGFSSFIIWKNSYYQWCRKSFNPYSTGFSSFIGYTSDKNQFKPCFNPYSTGFSSFIRLSQILRCLDTQVSILILLDSLLL